jgi:hypothetical protein
VNRVEDSLLLWRSIVANKLLARVNIILFLNKCDLLQVGLSVLRSRLLAFLVWVLYGLVIVALGFFAVSI